MTIEEVGPMSEFDNGLGRHSRRSRGGAGRAGGAEGPGPKGRRQYRRGVRAGGRQPEPVAGPRGRRTARSAWPNWQQAVLAAVNAAAGQGGGGLSEVLSAVLKGGFWRSPGGRRSGAAGRAYLVGERGPEVFRPAGAGSVEPAGRRADRQCHGAGRRRRRPAAIRRADRPGAGPGGGSGGATAVRCRPLTWRATVSSLRAGFRGIFMTDAGKPSARGLSRPTVWRLLRWSLASSR
jgi:hypothetical protein